MVGHACSLLVSSWDAPLYMAQVPRQERSDGRALCPPAEDFPSTSAQWLWSIENQAFKCRLDLIGAVSTDQIFCAEVPAHDVQCGESGIRLEVGSGVDPSRVTRPSRSPILPLRTYDLSSLIDRFRSALGRPPRSSRRGRALASSNLSIVRLTPSGAQRLGDVVPVHVLPKPPRSSSHSLRAMRANTTASVGFEHDRDIRNERFLGNVALQRATPSRGDRRRRRSSPRTSVLARPT